MSFEDLLADGFRENRPVLPLDGKIPLEKYCRIDLSVKNKDLKNVALFDPEACQQYIESVLKRNDAHVAYGGYLEERNLYADATRFSEGELRNIHLGVDFWCKAGTKVVVPFKGVVHSYKNNSDKGNYGPTIILEHQLPQVGVFYSLYGHLSVESLSGLYKGRPFAKGEVLAHLGTTDINVNYAPHLHFQLILDLQGNQGDYPGVCSAEKIGFYQKNCPNPLVFFDL